MVPCKDMWHNFVYLMSLDLLLFESKKITEIFSYSFDLARFEDKVNFYGTILRVKHVNVFADNVIVFVIYRHTPVLAI